MKTKKKRSFGSAALIIIAVIVLDQLTKLLIRSSLNLNESAVLIKNFLSLTFITNTGSIFGLWKGFNSGMIFISLIVLGFILYYWYELKVHEKFYFLLIIGGILGNLIDRIFLGYVVDFINFGFWPAFNIADSAITIGVIALIIYEWDR